MTNTVRHIKDENGRFGLGVVVSRPGDAIQNWHQDGDSLGEDMGKTYIAFMTASRVAGKNLGFSQDRAAGSAPDHQRLAQGQRDARYA